MVLTLRVIVRCCISAIKTSKLAFAALDLYAIHFTKAIFRGTLMNMPCDFPYMDLLPAVSAASFSVLEFFKGGFDVMVKDDSTPVTSADLASNKILLDALQKYFSDIPVVSEEILNPPLSALKDKFFLVDPLDGTSDFISGRKEFTVNLALIEKGLVALGIVSAPALGELFVGFNGIALRTSISDVSLSHPERLFLKNRYVPFQKGRVPRVLVSVSHTDPRTSDHLQRIGGVKIPVGSSLKFLRIADSFADYYPRVKSLHEWDIAAGHGVLKAAGGNVYLFGLQSEVKYGTPGFISPPFEAY